jgi:hypothetical protein
MTLKPPITPARHADRRSGPTGPATRRRALGTALRQLREERCLLLEEVACRLGVAPSTLSRIETFATPDEADIATYPSPGGHPITTTRHSDTDTMQALFTALARAAATPA